MEEQKQKFKNVKESLNKVEVNALRDGEEDRVVAKDNLGVKDADVDRAKLSSSDNSPYKTIAQTRVDGEEVESSSPKGESIPANTFDSLIKHYEEELLKLRNIDNKKYPISILSGLKDQEREVEARLFNLRKGRELTLKEIKQKVNELMNKLVEFKIYQVKSCGKYVDAIIKKDIKELINKIFGDLKWSLQ